MITLIFRKRLATVFSIENLFDALYAHLESSGVSVRRLELPHVSTGIVSVLRNAWFVYRQGSREILHVTGDVHYAALFCTRAKAIVTIHDCVVLQRGSGLKRFVQWLLWFGLPLRRAAAITVISRQTKSEVLRAVSLPEDKITFIPNFVNPAFTFSERPFAGARPRILHIGTTPNKNLARVVAALQDIPCVLVILGAIPAGMAADLTKIGIRYENHVGVNQETLSSLYRDADIISFPSTYEGFGMPIVEGQAVGRPVLTSDIEPMRSVSGPDGALLVNPHSTHAIRDGFIRLINDAHLRARLVTAGRTNSGRFTLESVAAAYLALYRRLESGTAPTKR
jgi:glycosyltransferase involved in cell wall biosynthesis